FIIGHMGLFFYNKIGSIISIGDLPTTNIIEPKKFAKILHSFFDYAILIYGLKKLPKTVGELDS
ncbi:hypothetical protein ACRE17_01630, partial [Streptococcus pneumoniae]